MAIILRNHIGKEFGDVVSELGTKYIKVGTVDGGAFFYCGSTSDLSDIIPKLNDENEVEHGDRILRAEEKLTAAVANFPDIKDYVAKEFKRTKGGKVGDVLGYLNFINHELTKVQMRINNFEIMKNETYSPLEKRIVADAMLSIDEEDTSIIIIEGREVGHYWSRAEYEKGVIPEDEFDTEVAHG